MNDFESMKSSRAAQTRPGRQTVALCGITLSYHIPIAYLTGATAAAQAADTHLLNVCTRKIDSPKSFEIQANILYTLLEAARLDGLLIASSLTGGYHSVAELSAFFQRYAPIPMVSIGSVMPGMPSIIVDNFIGMHAAVSHLIETHGSRRIAFLGGPRENPEAQERHRAYTTALADHDMSIDEGLVVYGDFNLSGPIAVQTWLDERKYRPGRDLEAIVAANDYMAIGALLELQRRGIGVPEDIAVVGFDDLMIGTTITPLLTTVRQPFQAVGRQAMELLFATMAGQAVPEITQIPTQLVVRQSCGCAEAAPRHAVADCGPSSSLPPMLRAPSRPFFQHLNRAISDNRESFEASDLPMWEQTLTVLRHALTDTRTETPSANEDAQPHDDVLSQAHAALGGMLLCSLAEKRETTTLMNLGMRISSTLNIGELMHVLAEELPKIGIRSASVSLYDNPPPYEFPQPLPPWSHLMLAYNAQQRYTLPPDGLRFPTAQILPPEFWPTDQALSLVIEPLYFQQEQIGFAVFEASAHEHTLYDLIRQYLSTSLQGALLIQRVQENSAEVVRQKYILDAFMSNVPDAIYFKDRESRILQINQAFATRVGLADPAEAIGKTDFDFFPDMEAQPKYEVEQTLLRTGEAAFSLEEPDVGGRWSLTTKMPLRDEYGAIIGTFGISRDITPLKQAQAELEQRSLDLAAAYEEIQILNTQLQEENLRMSAELDVSRRIQQMVLPTPDELRQIIGLDVVGYMQPADEVGGDYYDVLAHNGAVHVGIGDVTGHGLESGILMLMTQTAIRTLIEHGETDPKTFLTTLNRVFFKNVERMRADKTLTFVLIKYQAGHVQIVGQHEEILVVRQGGKIERIDTVNLGFPIGLETEIADFVAEAVVALEPGDSVVLYTDGITEAENSDRHFYGLDRLCAVLSRHWDQSAETMKCAVIDDLLLHIGTQKRSDDITLVVLKQQQEFTTHEGPGR